MTVLSGVLSVFSLILLSGGWDSSVIQRQDVSLRDVSRMKQHNVKADFGEYKGRKALRVTDLTARRSGLVDSMVILPEPVFQDGVIELELSGETGPNAGPQARGFVGIAFHVVDDGKKFECFYLRPTNGRADDQVRRNHSAQYISHPDYPWERLRKEFPEKYESYVDLVPGEWTKVRVEVNGSKARLFVHGASQPTLIVNDLKMGETRGAIALWIGPGTVAHFTDLRVSR